MPIVAELLFSVSFSLPLSLLALQLEPGLSSFLSDPLPFPVEGFSAFPTHGHPEHDDGYYQETPETSAPNARPLGQIELCVSKIRLAHLSRKSALKCIVLHRNCSKLHFDIYRQTMPTRPSLQSLKLQAYEMYGRDR